MEAGRGEGVVEAGRKGREWGRRKEERMGIAGRKGREWGKQGRKGRE